MDGIPSESPRVAIHHGIEIISFLRTLGVKEAAIKADIAGTSFMSIYTTKSFQVWKPAGLQALAREGAGAGIQ